MLRSSLSATFHYEQPLVVPQLSHTWQAPARCILIPQSKHIGASWSTGTEDTVISGIGSDFATASAVGAVGTSGSLSP